MRASTLSLLLAGLFFTVVSTAFADDPPTRPKGIAPGAAAEAESASDLLKLIRPDEFEQESEAAAQHLIDRCYARREDRHHITNVAKLREAYLEIIGCLEETFATRFPSIMDSPAITVDRTRAILGELRDPLQGLYYFMMAGNAGCRPDCPPQNAIKHLFPHAHQLEEMIREMEYARVRYKLPAPDGSAK